jgi:hypothetical protein
MMIVAAIPALQPRFTFASCRTPEHQGALSSTARQSFSKRRAHARPANPRDRTSPPSPVPLTRLQAISPAATYASCLRS